MLARDKIQNNSRAIFGLRQKFVTLKLATRDLSLFLLCSFPERKKCALYSKEKIELLLRDSRKRYKAL